MILSRIETFPVRSGVFFSVSGGDFEVMLPMMDEF